MHGKEPIRTAHTRLRCSQRRANRRGVITLWTILFIPVLAILLCVVIEGIHLWLARVELENALEASALAAVKEWAESGGSPTPGWTDGARTVGQSYAFANTIDEQPVLIGKNGGGFDPITNPNENERCTVGVSPPEGNLIFGAITHENPYVFEASVVPNCGTGRVLIDVTSQNPEDDDAAWGISFRADDNPWVNENLLITRVDIDLNPDGGFPETKFDFTTNPPTLSENSPQGKVQDRSDNEQQDNFGFVDWPSPPGGGWPANPQITFSEQTGTPTLLTIFFSPYVTGGGTTLDNGFSPGDRFRFGAGVLNRSGNSQNYNTGSADDVVGAEVTIYFGLVGGGPAFPSSITARMPQTTYRQKDCHKLGTWDTDFLGNPHLLVHPILDVDPIAARDLPCPSNSSSPNKDNDGQTFLEFFGGGDLRWFSVRAQATVPVPTICFRFCEAYFGPFYVSACSTAMYHCPTQRPRLIRVERENFHCP